MTADAPRMQGRANRDVTPDLSRLLVPPAMLITAIALAFAGHLHLGLTPEVATAAGVSLFCLMLMSHILLKAADDADMADEEAAERDAPLVASPMPTIPLTRDERSAVADEPPGAAPPRSEEAMLAVTPAAEASQSSDDAAWHFRPVELRQPGEIPVHSGAIRGETAEAALGSMRPAVEAHRFSPEAPSTEPISIDREADRIDAILKRLARQIHEGAAERGLGEVGNSAADERAEPELSHPAPLATVPLEEMAAANRDSALASAVDALRSTVEAMRGAGAPVAEPAPISAAEFSVAAVADAIQAESADVFLSPILGLSDQSARHFEVSVKLRADVADERSVAAGAGLLPLLDALNVRHATGFALMLQRRGRDGSVFSRVGGGSLESEQFVSDVAGRHAQGIADRMVLSFAQEEMRGLGPAQLTALEDLARLGFRFALQGVADLDMDFEALKAMCFDFVKLDAGVFQAGLMCSGEIVPAAEICDHFDALGLSVIVGDIVDADTRDRLVGWGVAYGQGSLFGEPRPVPVATSITGTMAA